MATVSAVIRRILLPSLLVAAAALLAPPAASAKSCSPPKYPGSGYFTSLSVKGVSCAKGRKVALAHYECRTENGRKGRCARKVKRFRCKEERFAQISTEFNSRVTCRRGGKRVKFTYQQNT